MTHSIRDVRPSSDARTGDDAAGVPRRVVACVDTGVDDALALAYLLASPDECELLGVVCGYGNVGADAALRNTRIVLDLFGRADVPVLRGSDHPSWADAFIPDAGCAQFHGADGLGGFAARMADMTRSPIVSPDTAVPVASAASAASAASDAAVVSVGGYPLGDPHANPAVEAPADAVVANPGQVEAIADDEAPEGVRFLVEQARRYGKGLTMLATGPLTDVDAAIRLAPDIVDGLTIVMMGGSLTQPGNCWDAVAETNVIQDPEAADRVFHAGADVTMVGLDVTHRCLLPRSAAERWRDTGTARGRFLAAIADFSITANREADPVSFAGGMPLHDPLAAAVALDPTLVSCFDIALRAERATGDFTGVRGRTTGDPTGLVTPDAPRVHVALDVDVRRFTDGFTARLAALCTD